MRIVLVATVASALGGIALGLVTREIRAPRDAEAVAGTPVPVRSPSDLSAEPVDIDPDWRRDLSAAIDAVADEGAVKELAEEVWAGAPDSVQRDEWLMAGGEGGASGSDAREIG